MRIRNKSSGQLPQLPQLSELTQHLREGGSATFAKGSGGQQAGGQQAGGQQAGGHAR